MERAHCTFPPGVTGSLEVFLREAGTSYDDYDVSYIIDGRRDCALQS